MPTSGNEPNHVDAFLANLNRLAVDRDFTSAMDATREEGVTIGTDKTFRLVGELSKAGRFEDLEKAASDKAFRDKLYQEFNIQ